jgi:hypothetical protein
LAVGDTAGALTFLGASGERVAGVAPALVINQLGRGGSTVSENLHPAQQTALLLLRSNLTVNLRGTNDELSEMYNFKPRELARSRFSDGLLLRFGLATQTGGCMYVPHAPNPNFSTALDAIYGGLARAAAQQTGCDYVDALNGVWTMQKATQWTTDGTHPTARGYSRLATALAAAIATRPELYPTANQAQNATDDCRRIPPPPLTTWE